MIFAHYLAGPAVGFESLDGLHDWVLCCVRGNAALGKLCPCFDVTDETGTVRWAVYGRLRADCVPVWRGYDFECIDARWTSALWPDGVRDE